MKNKIFLSLLFLSFLFTSCKDALDFEPVNHLSQEKNFSDFKTTKAALIAGYFVMTQWDYYGTQMILFPEVEANLCYINGNNNSRFAHVYQHQWSPEHGELFSTWATLYWIIDQVNNVVLHIDAVEGDPAEKNQVKGEALAMRALCYFDLVRYFAKQYTNEDPATDPGVPVVLERSLGEHPRNTVEEVYGQIISDLTAAEPLMTSSENKGRFTADATRALLARVYLYKGEWALAEEMASTLIDAGDYALADNFHEIFQEVTTSEEILTLEGWGPDCPYNPTCWDDIRVTTDLIEAYEDADVRKGMTAIQFPPGDSLSPYYQAKFNLGPRISILRLGEQYLIRAEARFRQNDIGGALEDLNTLRLKRGASEWKDLPNGIDDILEERHRELAFEGHTIYDYWRTGTDMVRKQCNTGVEVEAPCMIGASSHFTVHPIPKQEIDANSKMVQNEGY